MENNRTTFLIGAGTPLDLVLPQDVIKPATTKSQKMFADLTKIILLKGIQ